MANASYLPSIKCSNCNNEIPISMMGDHVCSRAPPLPSSRLDALGGPFAPTGPKHMMGGPLSRPQNSIPPRLNTSSTFDAILRSDQHLPEPIAGTAARSAAPGVHNNSRNSPFKMPFLRTTTLPLPSRPASPALAPKPQDCAFPPFPMARSQTPTPTTPLETNFNFPLQPGSSQERVEMPAERQQLNPQAKGDRDMIQRVNGIAPGPFSLAESVDSKPLGHRKSPSMGSSRDFGRVSRSTSPKRHVRRPSTSSSVYTRNHSFSSVSAGPMSPSEQDRMDVPVVPLILRPSFQDASDGSAHVPLPSFDFGSFDHSNRFRTFPENRRDAASSESRHRVERLHSEPKIHSHKPRPSVAAAVMQPLCEIGSASSFKPSRSVRGRAISPVVDKINTAPSTNAQVTELRDNRRLENTPPVPSPARAAGNFGRKNPYHKPQESTSSNGSCSSGMKSGSSISTPHESTSSNESYSLGMKGDSSSFSPSFTESPKQQDARTSAGHQANDMFKGFIFDVEGPGTAQKEQTRGHLRSSQMNDPGPHRPVQPLRDDAPVRSISPATSPTSPDEYIVASFAPQMNNLRVSPVPPAHPRPPEPYARRPSPANKGTCRGCGDFIQGKSVSSADGRLTGRYHKQCFVCHSCQQPFPTADFYVLNNQPYCARHYHELNDSLCTKCDRGIEGQYLETEMQQKFHPYCFSCQECHIILRDDYFEFNGRTLCEQHAFGAAHVSTPSSLGPGRKFPERRTTRLMMM